MSQSYRCPRAFLHRGSGGISPVAAPFPIIGKGQGDRVERAVKPLFSTAGLLAFRHLKPTCIKGFRARSAGGVVCLYVLRSICSIKANRRIRNQRDSGGDAANLFGTFCPKEPGLGRLPNKHFCGPPAQQKFRSVATPELLAVCAHLVHLVE